jgi:UPF0271 protein
MIRAIDLATELAEGFALPPGGIPLEDLERMTLGGTQARWHARHSIARHDEAMTRFVSTAYVACGMHSGDPVLLGRVVRDLAGKGIAVGVHPSYPDVFGFGQRRVSMTRDELLAVLLFQFGAVSAVAKGAGTAMSSVKCHGALGFDVSYDEATAAIMADAILRFDPSLTLVCMARSPGIAIAEKMGVKVAREAYVDRGYGEDARIVPRNHPSALITDVDRAVAQALSIAQAGEVASVEGKVIPLQAESLCMHSDTPGADRIAAAVRAALDGKGIQVKAIRGRSPN